MSGLDYTPVNSIAQFISSYIPITTSTDQTGGATIISFGLLIGLIILLIILLLVRKYKKYVDDKYRVEQFNAVQKKRKEKIKKNMEKIKKNMKNRHAKSNKHVQFDI